jgi:very-short-patch-repair endonuclease
MRATTPPRTVADLLCTLEPPASVAMACDALHEGTKIVVELDGQQFHGPERFQADRTRDQRLAAAGYVVLRFTWDDLINRPDDVIERLSRTMAQRARLAA